MKQLLNTLIERIEKMNIPTSEKDRLYDAVAEGLQKLVWPVLLKHMPEETLKEITAATPPNTAAYQKLLETTLSDETVLTEMESEMTKLLEAISRDLKN